MHCECCDVLLDDVEATAKFAESGRYVGMCTKCQRFLPKELKVVNRTDLDRSVHEGNDADNLADTDEGESYGYEEE